MRRRPWRPFWVFPGTALASTLNQTPEQGRKWETNREICLTVYMMGREALCLQVSEAPIKELCPWMPSPWVEREQLEAGWLGEEMSPVPHWSNRRTWMLPSDLEGHPMALPEAWVYVHHEAIQQEVWAEEWECPSALPWQGQGTGGCQGPAALWPDQATQA